MANSYLDGKIVCFWIFTIWNLINKTQNEYYESLAISDKAENATAFIEYMLKGIDQALGELLIFNNRTNREIGRIEYFFLKNFTKPIYNKRLYEYV